MLNIIIFLILGFFFLLGILISGALNKRNKIGLKSALNISELEESMMKFEQEANESLANQYDTKNKKKNKK